MHTEPLTPEQVLRRAAVPALLRRREAQELLAFRPFPTNPATLLALGLAGKESA